MTDASVRKKPANTIRVAAGTVNQTPLDWKGNTANIIDAIEEARRQRADILCLPELCITGYGCEDLFLSDWLAERAWEQLQEIIPHCHQLTVSVGLPVVIDGRCYNGACLIHDGVIQGITLKQHLAREGVHYEPRWFFPWQPGRVVTLKRGSAAYPAGDLIYTIQGIRIGFEICEDGWSGVDRPGYSLCDRGIDLILNPSASHFAMGKSEYREEEIVRRGSELFTCVYLMANLLGNESGRMIFDGDLIIAQRGKLLLQARRLQFQSFGVNFADIDFNDPGNSQSPQLLDVKDRNEELTQAVSLALFDFMRKSRTKGFVLSLSGGADSGSCALMVAEMIRRASLALGWRKFCELLNLPEDRVSGDVRKAVSVILTCAYQSTVNSSQVTFSAAKELAESIGATFLHWSIDDVVTSYTTKIENALQRKLNWADDDISLQNIQARSRSPVIWMLANIKGSILLTTSNRSEGDVGYATMDGDTSGSLAPIAGLSKVFILQWLQWAEAELGYSALANINRLQPTAELRPADRNQTDEDDLMPYPILLEIERHGIRDKKSPAEVFDIMKQTQADHELLRTYIRKFFRLWSLNQWKRERLAPSFHLDDMNVDPRTWCRFPILSAGFSEELEKL